ncbi:thiolase domain-containing protein [Candidatus Dojkabacteria bacterium]|uniref:Thiolase domain-containing protein n=1 Tax=Candidatus Dojkabacteria bacterium TaxID=2099670 RepID=A0A955L8X1_9BACT|nr:thiolase domain-containing protein [Candidatus Dojkabacteria bacterium]
MTYIAGSYTTKFGELWERDLRSLGIEAIEGALKDANIELKDIDALYVANMAASRLSGQDHIGSLIASELGIDVPAYHIESACASGGVAVRLGHLDILSGESKNILVLGVEKMTDISNSGVTAALSGASDEEWEAFYGATFPSLYAMIAREHMRKFGTTREQLALCSVKNHAFGSKNPHAQFPFEITTEQVLDASPVADPLGLLDCSPISDGASAIVLSKEKKSDVKIISSAQAQDTISLHKRNDITELTATVKAANKAFHSAGLNRNNIDIVELHDCFSIAEILAYEDLGFAKKGEGGKLIESGKTGPGGSLPVNTSGGLKACGHPVGATGVKQIAELASQLSGSAGARQISKNLKYGLAHNVGGSGGTAVVHILAKVG